MKSVSIIIFGATHVGLRLARRLAQQNQSALVLDHYAAAPEAPEGWEYATADFNALPSLAQARIVYIVTDEDSLHP